MSADRDFPGCELEREEGRSPWARARGRLFHLMFLLRRPMTLGARGLVLDRERNRVLLIRHTYVPGWQLPGGGVETGETVLEALERELREESHVELLGPPRLVSIHFNRHASSRDHVAMFLVTDFRQSAPFTGNREIAEAAFFPVDELPEATTPGTRRRIREAVFGEPVSPYW